MRTLSVLTLLVLTGCGASGSVASPGADGDAAPSDAAADAVVEPLRGGATWTDGCAMGTTCPGGSHTIEGSAASETIEVDCSVMPVFGGHDVSFRIARIPRGGNFDESDEALSASGFVPSGGMSFRANGGFVARVRVRGYGWSVNTTSIGEGRDCDVTLRSLDANGFTGSITCASVLDEAVPPRARRASGTFWFANCLAP